MLKKLQTILLLICIVIVSGISQSGNLEIKNLWADPDDLDFGKLQSRMENYYLNKDQGRGSGYKQWKRFEHRMKDRLDNEGRLTNVAARNYKSIKEYFNLKSVVVQTGDWEFLAPSTWSNGNSGYNPGIGRVNCIAFHPTDEDIIFLGTPNGGIWKTMDRGVSWIPLHDGMPSLGVSGIVVHPTNPDTIYILTGDGDGSDSQTIGVLKSYDAGLTWKETGLVWDIDDFEKGYKLIMHPTDYSTMLVVTTDGIWRTTDAAETWTQQATGTFRDIEYHPTDSDILYAEKGAGVYRSTNGGVSWSQITNGTPTGGNRLAIAVTPNHPDYVYLLCGPSPANGEFNGFYRSTNKGLSFTTMATTPNILGYSSSGGDDSSQNWYDIAIAAHPSVDNKVYTGGINVWRTTDGSTFTNISQWVYGGSQYTHADIHALEYNPINNYLYCGSDGGIFESTDGGDNWTNISDGLATMQFYKIAGTEADASLLLGGAQDNGSNKWDGGTDITHLYGADGMDCMINYADSDTIYISTQSGGLRRSINGGTSCHSVKPGGASGSWVTPYVMDPTDPKIIYGGYSDVYKSMDAGNTWTNKGADGRSALAIGVSKPQRLYAARNSTLRTTEDGGDFWVNVTGPWGSQNVTGIAINPDDDEEVFVTVSGYISGSKVYKSTNAGAGWTNVSGTLPNIPHNCIVFEDNDGSPDGALYVGTDIGVFYRNDDLGDWIPFTNGLPTVEVKDLEINYGAGLIRAATYGRSIWSSPLYTPCPINLDLTVANNPGQTDISTGYQYYQASDYISSSRNIGGGIGTYSEYKAFNYIDLNNGFTVQEGSEFYAHIGPCASGVPSKALINNQDQKHAPGIGFSENFFRAFAQKSDQNIDYLEMKTMKPRVLIVSIQGEDAEGEKVLYDHDYFPEGEHRLPIGIKLTDDENLIVKDANGNVLFEY